MKNGRRIGWTNGAWRGRGGEGMYVCLRRRSNAFSLTHVFFPLCVQSLPPKKDMNGKKGKLRARKYFWPKKCPILLFLSLSFPPLFPMAFLRAFYGEHDERRGGLYFPLTTPSLLFSSLFSQICTTADKTKINLFRLPTKPSLVLRAMRKRREAEIGIRERWRKRKKGRERRIWLVLHSTFVVAPPIPSSSISCLFLCLARMEWEWEREKENTFFLWENEFSSSPIEQKSPPFPSFLPPPFRHIRKSWLNTENQGRGEKEGGERGILGQGKMGGGKGRRRQVNSDDCIASASGSTRYSETTILRSFFLFFSSYPSCPEISTQRERGISSSYIDDQKIHPVVVGEKDTQENQIRRHFPIKEFRPASYNQHNIF